MVSRADFGLDVILDQRIHCSENSLQSLIICTYDAQLDGQINKRHQQQ